MPNHRPIESKGHFRLSAIAPCRPGMGSNQSAITTQPKRVSFLRHTGLTRAPENYPPLVNCLPNDISNVDNDVCMAIAALVMT